MPYLRELMKCMSEHLLTWSDEDVDTCTSLYIQVQSRRNTTCLPCWESKHISVSLSQLMNINDGHIRLGWSVHLLQDLLWQGFGHLKVADVISGCMNIERAHWVKRHRIVACRRAQSLRLFVHWSPTRTQSHE